MYRNSNVVVTGGHATYVAGDSVVNNQGRSNPGFEQLQNHVAAGALHNSGEVSDQPKCHPGTRIAILEYLEAWAAALIYAHPIVWLLGPAGSGKSSILRTIAQILFDQHLLLASFFFFRSAAGRNSSDHFITTIAYQLALSIPQTRPYIEEAIERNPLIFSLSLWDQARALIVSPILRVHRDNRDPSFDPRQFPRTIIVDGLDECNDPDKQCEIMQVLCRILQELPYPFAVLVASRPEHHIRGAFGLGALNRWSSRLALDNSYHPDTDIKKYLIESFRSIQENHPLKSCLPKTPLWPSEDVISTFVAKASGQFIYAATVNKFVSSIRHNPAKRLEMILGTMDAGNQKPFQQLDNLYSTIFMTVDPEDLPGTLRILGLFLVPYDFEMSPSHFKFRTPGFLRRLLELDAGDIRHYLFDLESLLTVDGDDEVRFFHASLGDYLFDRSRSIQFWIDSGKVYADLAQHCIIHLSSYEDWHGINKLELKEFFHLNSFLFFSKATLTLELRKAVESRNLGGVLDLSHWKHLGKQKVAYFKDLTPSLLLAIRNSIFLDSRELYLQKLASYAQIIRPRIQFYFKQTAFRHFLIAAVSAEVSYKERPQHCEALRCMFQISWDLWDSQRKRGLDLECSSPGLIQVMKDLIEDTHDSDLGYFVDHNQYADIALHLLKVMAQIPQVYLSKWANQNPRHSEFHPMMVLSQALNCTSKIFPVVLSKSSIRQDLLSHINSNCLNPLYLDFSSIRAAFKTYILRAESHHAIVEGRDSWHQPTTESRPSALKTVVRKVECPRPSKTPFSSRPSHKSPSPCIELLKRQPATLALPLEVKATAGAPQGNSR